VRGGVALARRRAPITPEAGPDQMMLGKKALEIFVRRSNVNQDFLLSRSLL
jgi:hypothetical protein